MLTHRVRRAARERRGEVGAPVCKALMSAVCDLKNIDRRDGARERRAGAMEQRVPRVRRLWPELPESSDESTDAPLSRALCRSGMCKVIWAV